MHTDHRVTNQLTPFHAHPNLAHHSDQCVMAFLDRITMEKVRKLSKHAGAVWQFEDLTDIFASTIRCSVLTSTLHSCNNGEAHAKSDP